MGRRDDQISRSIVFAIQRDDKAPDKRVRLWKPIKTFFALYGLFLTKLRPELFQDLRNKTWQLSEEEYKAEVRVGKKKAAVEEIDLSDD